MTMLIEIKQAFRRCRPTLMQDAAGAAALVVMFLAVLHLPAVS